MDRRVDVEGETAVLRVTDNGRGLQPQERRARGHLGLVGMQERANLLGAALDIISAPGQGTMVVMHIPAGEARREQ